MFNNLNVQYLFSDGPWTDGVCRRFILSVNACSDRVESEVFGEPKELSDYMELYEHAIILVPVSDEPWRILPLTPYGAKQLAAAATFTQYKEAEV